MSICTNYGTFTGLSACPSGTTALYRSGTIASQLLVVFFDGNFSIFLVIAVVLLVCYHFCVVFKMNYWIYSHKWEDNVKMDLKVVVHE
jgi:tetrahydromethanopterin S-methyltransferase subunit D